MTYRVERIQGQVGFEETIWTEEIEADSAAEAIRRATPTTDEAIDFPIEARDGDFAASQNPQAGRRYSDGVIAELA